MAGRLGQSQPEAEAMVELEDDLDDYDDADDIGGQDDAAAYEMDAPPKEDHVDWELLMSVAHGLGKWMEDTNTGEKVYVRDKDCIGCLKDLQRFLRRDDPDLRPVFRRLGTWRVAQQDLVPLLCTYAHEPEVTLQAVKVLTYLTMPVDPSSARPEEQEGLVRDVKEAMLHQDALVAVLGLVAEPLAAHPRMSPEQQGAVQLVLAFLRNLLAVPDERRAPNAATGSDRTRLQASLLTLLFSEHIMELLALVAQHGGQAPLRREMPVLLEALHEAFRGVTPEQLMAAREPPPEPPRRAHREAAPPRVQQQEPQGPQGPRQPVPGTGASTTSAFPAASASSASATAATSSVKRPSLAALHKASVARSVEDRWPGAGPRMGPPGSGRAPPTSLEQALQAQKRRQALEAAAKMRAAPAGASRHSGWGGKFVVSHVEDSDQRCTFLTKPAPASTAAKGVKAVILEAPPKFVGPRPPASSLSASSNAALLWQLRGFADGLLASGYNQMMEVVRREVAAGVGVGRLERPDLLRFLRLGAFFTQYCRLKQAGGRGAGEGQEAAPAPAPAKPAPKPAPASTATGADGAAPAEPTAGAGADPPAAAEPSEAPDPESPFSGISGTMGWDTFHLVQGLWVAEADRALKHKDWELQAASTRLLREMLGVLVVAHRLGTPGDRRAADRLQRKLLHDDMAESGLLPVLGRIMAAFHTARQSRDHAADLMMCLHYVLRMYDRLTSTEPGGFMVKARRRTAGRKPRRQQGAEEGEEGTEGEGGAGEEGGEDKEGSGGEGGEEEGGEGGDKGARKGGKAPLDELAEGSDEEDEEEEAEERVVEKPLDLLQKVRSKLAQPAIIHFAASLLACYRQLPACVPRAIASLLHRIADHQHLDMEPLLYQLSVLRVFYVMLADQDLRTPAKLQEYRPVLTLAARVVRGLMRRLAPSKYPAPGAKGAGAGANGSGGARPAAGPPDADATQPVAGAGADPEAARHAAQRKELQEKIEDNVPRMLCVDLLFWKDHHAAAAISQGYWLPMALEDWDREETERAAYGRTRGGDDLGGDRAAAGGGGAGGAHRRRRGGDAWGDDDGEGGGDGGAAGGAASDGDDEAEEGAAPRTGGRLRRQDRGGSGDGDGGDGDDLEDDVGGGRAAGGGGRAGGRAVLSDDEGEPRPRAAAAAAPAPAPAPARKPMSLQEREEMLRKRFLKTVRVGNGKNKRSGNLAAAGAGGPGGRGLQLSGPQQALLGELFERYNASRHNADLMLEGMKRGGRRAAGGDGGDSDGDAEARPWDSAEGVEMSGGQLTKWLKQLGLKFKQLTEGQLARLRVLWGRYASDDDAALMIAAQLPGGWSSKDVTRLLKKHGFVEGSRRRRGGGRSDSGSGSDSGGSGGEGGGGEPEEMAALAGAEEELGILWEEHGAGGQADAVERITEALDLDVSEESVACKLRQMGLLPGGKGRRKDPKGGGKKRGGGRGGRGRGGEGGVDLAALRALWEAHRSQPDHLNVIAALLPGGRSVKQVQRLLRSQGLLEDDAARRRRTRDAAERTRLVALYQACRGEAAPLEAMAARMPELQGGAKQVAKLLRKHGLLEGPGRGRRRSGDGGEEGERAAKPRLRKAADEPEDAGPIPADRVPEPHPERLLQALAGVAEAHAAGGGRWLDPAGAVGWVLAQMDRAEELWALAGSSSSGGGPLLDYCLVLGSEADEEFFMTEYSQDLLEACGIRSSAGDYFKIPASAPPAWRQRVRAALREALGGLGGERAAALAAALRERKAAEEEARKRELAERDEAEAKAAAAALFSGAAGRSKEGQAQEERGGGVGGRGGRGGRGRGRGGRGGRGAKASPPAGGRRRKSKAHTDEEEGAAGDEEEQAPGGRSGGVESSESSSGSDSESSSSGSSSGSDSEPDADGAGGAGGAASDAEEEVEAVMPYYSESEEEGGGGGKRKKGPAAKAAPPPKAKPAAAAKGKAQGKAGAGKKGSPAAAAAAAAEEEDGEAARKARGKEAAAAARRRAAAALAGSDSEGEGAGGRRAGAKPRRKQVTAQADKRSSAAPAADGAGNSGGGSDDGGGAPAVDADARRRALAELARRRQEQAQRLQQRAAAQGTLVPTQAPAAVRTSAHEDLQDEVAEGEEALATGGAAAGSRRRRGAAGGPLAGAVDDGNAGESDGDGSDGGGAAGAKRRRLVRRGAMAGLGTGKENVAQGEATAPGKAGRTVEAEGGDEMVELEDGLEDF
ncbi:hypothetical protein HYH03_009402 [Edaphochlamys debaryana]|uniref:Timeless N-terminal domain-containing protein n=1 Tax=Edaphochlamys debaryana TaxID=47281 RepID=A0A836BX80_9CHLO|nr:hypothetical protein HYH03_009402 [Edaphochlamys debaryana]|eukprot:KAG2492461.1 hypothetical protein HYH03_009402 [Edaphochlamys debaryana]